MTLTNEAEPRIPPSTFQGLDPGDFVEDMQWKDGAEGHGGPDILYLTVRSHDGTLRIVPASDQKPHRTSLSHWG